MRRGIPLPFSPIKLLFYGEIRSKFFQHLHYGQDITLNQQRIGGSLYINPPIAKSTRFTQRHVECAYGRFGRVFRDMGVEVPDIPQWIEICEAERDI